MRLLGVFEMIYVKLLSMPKYVEYLRRKLEINVKYIKGHILEVSRI